MLRPHFLTCITYLAAGSNIWQWVHTTVRLPLKDCAVPDSQVFYGYYFSNLRFNMNFTKLKCSFANQLFGLILIIFLFDLNIN